LFNKVSLALEDSDEIQCVLKVDDDYQLKTLDEIALLKLDEGTQIDNEEIFPGNLLRVSLANVSINEQASDIAQALCFQSKEIFY